MLEQTIGNAIEPVQALGLAGSMLIFMALVLIWVTRQWLLSMKATDAAKAAHLEDVKAYAMQGEATRSVLESMRSGLESVRAALEIVRDRTRP